MKTTKLMNERILSLMAENRAQVELLQDVRGKAKERENDVRFNAMNAMWNVEEWLIAEVIQPALEEALINQELKNW
jgi:hypothetical protein